MIRKPRPPRPDQTYVPEWGNVDTVAINLCRAVNEIPGFETTSSCCGHGRDPFWVWFICRDARYLYPLGRALDRRYGGYGFRCVLDTGDLPDRGNTLLLESIPIGRFVDGHWRLKRGSERGADAYAAADALATRIREFLGDAKLMRYYGLS